MPGLPLPLAAARPAVATLVEDFEAGSVDFTKWPNSFGVSQSGGFGIIPATTSYNQFATGYSYSLRESFLVADIPVITNVGNGTTDSSMEARLVSGDYTRFVVEAGTLYAQERAGGVTTNVSVAYNSVNHRWWRIRETAGTMYWETSPNGTSWTTIRSKASVILDQLEIALIAGYYGTEPTPGSMQIASLNIIPTDVTPPVITIGSPSASKISRVPGKDAITVTIDTDEAFVEYEVRLVVGESSLRTSGTQVETAVVSSRTSHTITITDDELVSATAVEGANVLKAFVRDAAGNWSP
jgi:hypothetical protein